jgi:hypothetical protein
MANSREIWSAGTAWRTANAAICSRRAKKNGSEPAAKPAPFVAPLNLADYLTSRLKWGKRALTMWDFEFSQSLDR